MFLFVFVYIFTLRNIYIDIEIYYLNIVVYNHFSGDHRSPRTIVFFFLRDVPLLMRISRYYVIPLFTTIREYQRCMIMNNYLVAHPTNRKWVKQPWWFQWEIFNGMCVGASRPQTELGWTNPPTRFVGLTTKYNLLQCGKPQCDVLWFINPWQNHSYWRIIIYSC